MPKKRAGYCKGRFWRVAGGRWTAESRLCSPSFGQFGGPSANTRVDIPNSLYPV